MKTFEIRKLFLDYFKGKKHTIVKSDSLIPRNDPTLLFTGAGMNQFKDYFLGCRTDLKRAASSQKCLRTGDLDNVGKTPYHHSFFEMLGNFSFGDYFKEEAIAWAWEFITQTLKLLPERIYVSVHEKDDEAYDIWTKKIGIPKNRIAKLGDKSNFWPADAPKVGPNGPCGPCSEIFYDQGETYPGAGKGFWAEDESGRYAEFWNLVFTQFERQDGGKLVPLKAKNIDTGMGLERLACIIQGKKNNFEIDIFQPMVNELVRKCPKGKKVECSSLYAIVDHVRAVVISIADGAHPSNEGRGYVIRKLIRRAVWRGRMSELSTPMLAPLVSLVMSSLEDAYPELRQAEKSIEQTISAEENRFQETLESGLNVLSKFMNLAEKRKEKILRGEEVFQLYDTYGFPDELTRLIAKKSGIKTDDKGFEALLEEQRKRAKASSKLSDTIFAGSDVNQELLKLPETKFLGYTTLRSEGKVIWTKFSGSEGMIALDQSPFYPEGGGQVGDVGSLENKNFKFVVSDTQKQDKVILHYGRLEKGTVKVGGTCNAEVNKERREATKRNHTATHLLQAALRTILGTHVRQVGSLVNSEKVRFDFTHAKALSVDEIKKIELWVNEAVLESAAVESKHLSYQEAMKSGTLAFFGDKYGDEVRVIDVPGKSRELCGGTHCQRTGEIGAFVIVSETSIGSGTRRIEALTGLNAVAYLKGLEQKMNQISTALKSNPDQILERIEKLQQRIKELEKGSTQAKSQPVNVDALIESASLIGTVKLITQTIPDLDIQALRQVVDQIKMKSNHSVIVLFSSVDSKVNMIVALTKDLSASTLDAKSLAQQAAELIDGSAGGRKEMAQGGGRNPKGIDSALTQITNSIRKAGI